MNTVRNRQAVQSVSRALVLLKYLGRHHEEGLDIRALTDETGLNRSTVFRLLTCLQQADYVQREEASGRYRLGINAMQLGLTAMTRPPLVERCIPMMRSIARMTEDTVFLVVRNGDFAHCLHLEQGAFPVRVIATLAGSFRLIGFGTAGLALLSTLNPDEFREVFARHAKEYEKNGLPAARLRNMIKSTHKHGYAFFSNLLIPGASAVSVPFGVPPGHVASLSIAAISSRLNDDRAARLATHMKEALQDEGLEPVYR